MKSSNTTNKSATSVSLKSVRISEKDEYKVPDFDECLKIACTKFNIPGNVYVNKAIHDDSFLRSLKQESKSAKKSLKSDVMLGRRSSFTLITDRDDNKILTIPAQKENLLVVTPVYDTQNKLIEISINEAKTVPRLIVKILGFIIPQFSFLTKIAIKKCKLDKYIIYEITKFLDLTSVTNICFDGSSCREANFALLLQNTRISNLSLCRCGINDVVCETIASQLHYTLPGQCRLTTLNLSSNRITDVGAECLGLALRSNRYLRYLNLAGNCITDEGANHILKHLMYFPLTLEEFNAERVSYGEYLKSRIKTRPVEDLSSSPAKRPKFSESASKFKRIKINKLSSVATKDKKRNPSTVTRSVTRSVKEALHSSVTNLTAVSTYENLYFNDVSPYEHPFSNYNVNRIHGVRCCKGNMVLCYLNLAYNDISYLTVKRLNEVLKYQSLMKSSSEYGLVKVVIEGNNLPNPEGCTEMEILNDLLNKPLLYTPPRSRFDAKLKPKKYTMK